MRLRMIVAATGHRPNKLGGYGDDITKALHITASKALDGIASKVISGMALGWDMAIASAAVDLDIPFIAAVPFKGQESVWPDESKRKYNILLSKADDVVYVCDDGYASWKMQKRNEWMVDNCDILLALWDGSSGGTDNCIKYAKKQGKKIINVWKYWKMLNDYSRRT